MSVLIFSQIPVLVHEVAIMKFIYLIGFFCSCILQVFAQTTTVSQAIPQDTSEPMAQREQRRIELRTALKAQHQVGAQSAQRKQFSEQDRYVLRQQLRQQQEAGKPRP